MSKREKRQQAGIDWDDNEDSTGASLEEVARTGYGLPQELMKLAQRGRSSGQALPEGSIVPLPNGAYSVFGFVLTPIGLELEREVTAADWEGVGNLLRRLEGSIQWLIGDWILLGERKFKETYLQYSVETGYERQSLRDLVYVCSNVDLSVRTDKLTFTHHKLVAGLEREKQIHWLKRALEGDGKNVWTVAQMRRAIAEGEQSLQSDESDIVQAAVMVVAKAMQKQVKKLKRHGSDPVRKWIAIQRQMLDEIERGLK
jgi:hypothetical protein